jgi:hypothetical protein
VTKISEAAPHFTAVFKVLTYLFYFMQDYEYSSYNPVAYDIANHFCEMAANYHTDTPHILDYSKYPGIFYYILDLYIAVV